MIEPIIDTSSGCFVVRTNSGTPELLMVFCRWSNGTEGWIIPKGHVEEGETKEETAKREVLEESGYSDIEITEYLKEVNFEFTGKDGLAHKKTIHWHLGKLKSDTHIEPKRTADEKISMKKVDWKSLEEALELMPFPDEKGIIQQLIVKYKQ
jgi:8-oxo-dGTP pyrophosphatase MutT (NUDIX family)